MADAEVTILIPNYKTPEMTRLCLRLLRRHTDLERVQVVVIDNGSGDASLDYLRGVNWIRLIERPEAAKEKGPEMHARALDLALKEVTTPYVLVMHTDTLICNDGWLDFLLGKISGDETVAGVGSWKLEEPPSAFKQFGKKIESLLRRLLGKKTKVEERYLRSHCALYRTELIRKRRHRRPFAPPDAGATGVQNAVSGVAGAGPLSSPSQSCDDDSQPAAGRQENFKTFGTPPPAAAAR